MLEFPNRNCDPRQIARILSEESTWRLYEKRDMLAALRTTTGRCYIARFDTLAEEHWCRTIAYAAIYGPHIMEFIYVDAIIDEG